VGGAGKPALPPLNDVLLRRCSAATPGSWPAGSSRRHRHLCFPRRARNRAVQGDVPGAAGRPARIGHWLLIRLRMIRIGSRSAGPSGLPPTFKPGGEVHGQWREASQRQGSRGNDQSLLKPSADLWRSASRPGPSWFARRRSRADCWHRELRHSTSRCCWAARCVDQPQG